MRIVADENVHRLVIAALCDAGHEVYSVAERAGGTEDGALLLSEPVRGAIFLTYDRDFGELIIRRGMALPAAIVYVRMPPRDAAAIAQRLLTLLASGDISGRFIVVQPNRMRSRNMTSPGASDA